ncbi:DUF1990 domain-containing protein [Occallatibacter riparius]|uniref:DUF1990 domain-containing protein n=1 Tax=Occallatibacter riparius TaxID=1002689 RepID=A0A9J7BHB1_9BACT|nr:DUF1990 domain-containing protein [Occallatibacter riparius]UWZ81905.1 DUF1990 domain-containing protein [Occallatibacter riparius]
MFSLTRPNQDTIDVALNRAAGLPAACPNLLSLRDGLTATKPPWGFAHDVSLSQIGKGESAFARARLAMEQWAEFDLGWVRVANPTADVRKGELVAVEAHTVGLWSLNLSRIVETVNTPDRIGFLYATTALHIEEGQERFLIELDRSSGRVLYLIEAVSRPRHLLARLGWPLGRAMQSRFRRDSHARMRRSDR